MTNKFMTMKKIPFKKLECYSLQGMRVSKNYSQCSHYDEGLQLGVKYIGICLYNVSGKVGQNSEEKSKLSKSDV
jgi:hypothetical protein